MELPDPPEGWRFKSLSVNEGDETKREFDCWTAYLKSDDEYVYGYGSSPRYAMLDALRKIEECDTFVHVRGTIGHVHRSETIDLVSALNIPAPAKPTVRRF